MALSRRTGGRSRLTLALLILTSLAVLTLDFRDASVIQSARDVAGTVFSPLKGVAESASRPFTNAWRGITDYGDVQAENDQLRARIAELEGRDVLNEDAAQQLKDLTAQLNLEWVQAFDTQAARVLAGPASNFSHTVDISKGSRDGIKVGMPVVNGAGLVGRVVQVNDHRSTVQLITDPDFKVGIRLLASGALGTAQGQGRGKDLLVDTALEPDGKVVPKKHSRLSTSGIDRSPFPASIPVGTVTRVSESPGGLTLDLVVHPMADTEQLEFVTVILYEGGE